MQMCASVCEQVVENHTRREQGNYIALVYSGPLGNAAKVGDWGGVFGIMSERMWGGWQNKKCK